MESFWEETLKSSVKMTAAFPGSYSMSRTLGQLLSQTPLRRPVVVLAQILGRLDMIEDGHVDLGWSIPAIVARWAMDGHGPEGARPLPRLRGVARFPHADRLMIATAPWSEIRTLADVAPNRWPLRIGIRRFFGYGWYENKIFGRYGFNLDEVVSWGGRHWQVTVEYSGLAREVETQAVDLVIGTASTLPIWSYLAAHGFRFLGLDPSVVASLEQDEGMEATIIPAGFLPGIHAPLFSVDESDFLLVARDDAEDSLIYELAKAIDQNRQRIEEGTVTVEYLYTKPLPVPELVLQSALTGPIRDPWRSPIPLQPAAERYYRERGYL